MNVLTKTCFNSYLLKSTNTVRVIAHFKAVLYIYLFVQRGENKKKRKEGREKKRR